MAKTVTTQQLNELESLRARVEELEEMLADHAEPIVNQSPDEQPQYREMFDAVLDGLVVLDVQGKIVDSNAAGCRMHGCSRDEFVGENPRKFIHPEDHHLFDEFVGAVRAGKTYQCDARGLRKDGSVFYAEVHGSPILIKENTHIVAVVRDITRHKEAEISLKESEANYADLFDRAPDGLSSVDATNGCFVECNQTLADMLGYSKKEIIGRPVFEIVHPDYVDSAKAVFRQFRQTGEVRDFELQILRKDGFATDISLNATAVRDDHGNILRSRAIYRDIREKKRFEEKLNAAQLDLETTVEQRTAELARSEEKWRSLVATALDTILILDLDGTIQYINRIEEGFTRDDVIGSRAYDYVRAEYHEEIKSVVEEVVRTGEFRSYETAADMPDGSTQWYSTRVGPYREKGEIVGVTCIATNDTNRIISAQALRDSEERFRGAFENMTVGMTIVDTDGNFIRVNRAFEQMIGYTADELECLTVFDITHSEDQVLTRKRLKGHSKGKSQPSYVEKRYIHKDGHTVWGLTSAGAVFMQDGHAPCAIGPVQDITQRVLAEQALRLSEERFGLAVRGSFVGLWDWDITTDKEWWSARFYELLGYADGEIEATYSQFLDLLRPEDKQRITQAVRAHLEKHDPYDVEYRLRTKSGDFRWIHARGQAIWNQAGQPTRMAGSISDISDRKRTEKALRTSEERFDVAVQGANVGLWDWDISAGNEWWSARYYELLGYRDGEIPASHDAWLDQLHPDDKELVIKAVQAHLQHAVPYDLEYRLRDKSGEYHWFHARGRAIRDSEGRAMRMAGSIRDICDRKQAEDELKQYADELEQSNLELQRFAYIVSHDLKEPLRAVASFSDLLARRYRGSLDHKADEWIHFIVDGAKRMQGLIDDLLTYSRVGSASKSFEPCDSSQIVNHVLASLKPLIDETKATVHRGELPVVIADASQLAQVFQNLIENAIKYRGPEFPSIHVSAQQLDDNWVFAVKDNGIGIESEYREQIFEVFRRLHHAEDYPGTGVGLAICRKVVNRHGGRIWIESAPGRGSTCFFTLPLHRDT